MSAVSLLKSRRRECNSPVVRAKLDRTGLREQPADPTLRRDQLGSVPPIPRRVGYLAPAGEARVPEGSLR